jgi:hypothetical protein
MKVDIHISFYGDDSWSVALQQKFGTVEELTTSFIWIVILFDVASKHGDGANVLGYDGTKTVTLCAVFCNFVHCHILVSYLNFCLSVRLCISP